MTNVEMLDSPPWSWLIAGREHAHTARRDECGCQPVDADDVRDPSGDPQ